MLWSRHLELSYPFQNTALDYSGNARHGTVNGSGVYATRPNSNRCLYFDGVGDYVATPSFGLSGTVVVFAAHVRCKLYATYYQTFLSDAFQQGTSGFFFSYRLAGSNNLSLQYAYGSGRSVFVATNYFAAPYEDTWLHMTIVCDYAGKRCYFYRNGILVASPTTALTPLFPSANRTKYLGVYHPTQGFLTDGYLDEVFLATLPAMPSTASMTANVNRIMLGMHPIW